MADDFRQTGLPVQRTVGGPPFDKALLVEDDDRLRETVQECLRAWAAEVRTAGTLADALGIVQEWHPDLMVLDFRLPDGDARQFLRRVSQHPPVPSTIAMSAFARPDESFELAQLGVRAYIQKPFTRPVLEAAIHQASTPPDLTAQVREAVGRTGLHEVEEGVRRTMIAEALGRAAGNRRRAARLLGVSRQFVQHVVRKLVR